VNESLHHWHNMTASRFLLLAYNNATNAQKLLVSVSVQVSSLFKSESACEIVSRIFVGYKIFLLLEGFKNDLLYLSD